MIYPAELCPSLAEKCDCLSMSNEDEDNHEREYNIPNAVEDLLNEKDPPKVLKQKMGDAAMANRDGAHVPILSMVDNVGKSPDKDAANLFEYG